MEQWKKLPDEEGEERAEPPRLPRAHAAQNHTGEEATAPPLPSNGVLRHLSG